MKLVKFPIYHLSSTYLCFTLTQKFLGNLFITPNVSTTLRWSSSVALIQQSYTWGRMPSSQLSGWGWLLMYQLMRSQPHPLNQEEGILSHVYDTLIREDTPHMHRASTAQNWLPGHMLTVRSHVASHLCIYECLLICYCCISATEEDHRSVVETFGVFNKFPKTFGLV